MRGLGVQTPSRLRPAVPADLAREDSPEIKYFCMGGITPVEEAK